MSEPYDQYPAGTAVRWTGRFEEEVLPSTDPPTYALTDPTPATSVVAEARHRDGTTISKAYTVDAEVVREAEGVYRCILPLEAGMWTVGFRGPSGWVGSRRVLMTDPGIP